MNAATLASVLSIGIASELDYMTAEAAAECLDRFAFLLTCDETELCEMAEAIALTIAASAE